jgi:hypothetical protein
VRITAVVVEQGEMHPADGPTGFWRPDDVESALPGVIPARDSAEVSVTSAT